MVSGPARALEEVAELEKDGRLARYQYLPAIKADLLRRTGRSEEASLAYLQALESAGNDAERAFLAERLTDLHRARLIASE
jgi:RNA polymerase sigma-70 factor (ECF subfamily)